MTGAMDLVAEPPVELHHQQGRSRSKIYALMASGTLVSRLLGFVRTALLAMAIGSVTSVADIFEKANVIPTIIYMLLAGTDSVPVLWPLLVAVVVSSLLSYPLLRGPRERFALRIEERARRATERFEATKAKEDVD